MTSRSLAHRGARAVRGVVFSRRKALAETAERQDHERATKRLDRRVRKVDRRVRRFDRRLRRRLEAIERRLPPEALVAPIDYAGARIELRARTARERYRLTATAKEPWTVEWIETWISPGDILYDIGANVGAYALIAAKSPAAPFVVAFEPGFASYSTLCENVAHNGAADRVMPLPLALSDATGMSFFSYRDLGSGEALHGLGDGEEETVFRQSILTFTLDELVERLGLPTPCHLKLDVDGAEAAVLAGARAVLRSPQLRTVMTEVSTADGEALAEHLEAGGLERRQRTEPRVKHGKPTDQWYELWVRPTAG